MDHRIDALTLAFEAAMKRRLLWRPDRAEQRAAIETLLASDIPAELRLHLKDREKELAWSFQ